MKARVHVMPKAGVLDPQGKAISGALNRLGFDQISDVRAGKVIDLVIEETDEVRAREVVRSMCEKLLANTVIESYVIELRP